MLTSNLEARLLALAVALLPALSFAQAGKIESGLNSALNWATGIGILLGAIGVVRAGVKIASGDPDGKEAAKGALMGSVLVLIAAPLLQLLKAWFN